MTQDQNIQPEDSAGKSEIAELLAFRIGEQEYCVDIMAVREIRGWSKATPLPHSPAYMRGVINLRGTVLPIIDLAQRLNLDEVESSDRDVVIVVNRDETTVGLLVSAVSDIVPLEKKALQAPPNVGNEDGPEFIASIAVLDGRLIRILDLPTVMPKHCEAAA